MEYNAFTLAVHLLGTIAAAANAANAHDSILWRSIWIAFGAFLLHGSIKLVTL